MAITDQASERASGSAKQPSGQVEDDVDDEDVVAPVVGFVVIMLCYLARFVEPQRLRQTQRMELRMRMSMRD